MVLKRILLDSADAEGEEDVEEYSLFGEMNRNDFNPDDKGTVIEISSTWFYAIVGIIITLLILNILFLCYTSSKNCCKSNKAKYTKVAMVASSDDDIEAKAN